MSSSETVSMFCTKALQKIFKDSSRRHTKLREAIKVALDTIQTSPLSHEESPEWDKLANKLVIAIKLSCETRQSKIMDTALDALQKLMAYGLIRGTAHDEEKADRKLMDKVIDIISTCFDFPDDNVRLQVIKAFLTAVTSPVCDIHGTCLMTAIRSVYNIYLISESPINTATAKATLTQMLNIVFQRMEVVSKPNEVGSIDIRSLPNSPALKPPEPNANTDPSFRLDDISEKIPTDNKPIGEAKESKPTLPLASPKDYNKSAEPNVFFADCFKIFRALCKLSTKDVPEGVPMESLDMKSKILSLELISMVLESSAHVFKASEKFINNAIKNFLCESLLINGKSSVARVFKLCLSICLSLMSHFREHLKAEIGEFFSQIFLGVLEGTNSTIQQKWMVLQVLYQVCKNPQTLVDIFVNYDCDLEGKDIFERMVYDLSRVAQGGNAMVVDHWASPAQELKVKTLGLECLVTIMKSLVDWSRELFEENEKEHSLADENNVGVESDSSVSDVSDEQLDQLRKQKQYKVILETGKAKFAVAPRREYLIQAEAIKREPADIAQFFRNTEGLDKTRIGEYLGDHDAFHKQVLYAYVDLFSFKGLDIDVALREFVSHFRLPGEGQKIDRVIEKFAERYYNDNLSNAIITSADSAYVLAFAIVLLATDMHNPTLKVKMTKQDWYRLNAGNNDKRDFDEAFLSEVYDRIANEPFKLKGAGEIAVNAKEKHIRFIKEESDELMKRSQVSIQEKLKCKDKFFTAIHIEHVRPMFELAWCPMLAAFSVLLEDSEDSKVISLCLEGFRHAVHVACIFFMSIERSTFITSLSKFTLLESLKEMRQKNIESIKTLINIANTEANYLQESWLQVLRCVSLLERLHVIGSGVKVDVLIQSEGVPADKEINSLKDRFVKGITTGDFFLRGNSAAQKSSGVEEINAEQVAQQIDSGLVDRLFSNSINMSNSAIVSFVKCLCEISVEEINTVTPRIFSLQKLVEICYFNMNRIRIVWTSIWATSSNHFTKIGCHDNLGIAMYAIDSLKQLALKFLAKDELAHFTYQKEFLRPFELIIHNNPSVQIRELVIRCLTQMIQSRATNIKSGWKTLLLVFATAASDTDESIVHLAFTTVDSIMKQYFQLVASNFFLDCISCVAAFGWNKINFSICEQAIGWLEYCGAQLVHGSYTSTSKQYADLWLALLNGLSRIVSHKASEVRTRALEALFNQLTSYGGTFDQNLWREVILRVMLPMFKTVGYCGNGKIEGPVLQEDNEWLNTSCLTALHMVVNLFSQYFSTLSFMLHDILDLLVTCILQENDNLSQIASNCLLELVGANNAKFTDEMWSSICDEYAQIVEQTIPREIYQISNAAKANAVSPLRGVSDSRKDSPAGIRKFHSALSLSKETGSVVALATDSSETIAQPQASPLSSPPPSPPQNRRGSSGETLTILDSSPARPLLASTKTRKRAVLSPTQNLLTDLLRTVKGKCSTQLTAVQAIEDIAFKQYSFLGTHHVISFLDTIHAVHSFTHQVSNVSNMRELLSRVGASDLLNKLEIFTTSCYLRLLFKLYKEKDVDASNRRDQAEKRLISRCASIILEFLEGSVNSILRTPIIVQILNGIMALEDEQFSKHLGQFYELFVDLMLQDNKEIRETLKPIMARIASAPEWLLEPISAEVLEQVNPTPELDSVEEYKPPPPAKESDKNDHNLTENGAELSEPEVMDQTAVVEIGAAANEIPDIETDTTKRHTWSAEDSDVAPEKSATASIFVEKSDEVEADLEVDAKKKSEVEYMESNSDSTTGTPTEDAVPTPDDNDILKLDIEVTAKHNSDDSDGDFILVDGGNKEMSTENEEHKGEQTMLDSNTNHETLSLSDNEDLI